MNDHPLGKELRVMRDEESGIGSKLKSHILFLWANPLLRLSAQAD